VNLVDIGREELVAIPTKLRLTLLVSHFHVNLVDIGREELIANPAGFPLFGLFEHLIRICRRRGSLNKHTWGSTDQHLWGGQAGQGVSHLCA
jgi:hypothetical protein